MTLKQREAITRHGFQLLRIFPNAEERWPLSLCKRLRRVETAAHRHAERLCMEDVSEAEDERTKERLLHRARRILGNSEERMWLSCDWGGYALKMGLREGEELHRDWGGYGIIAPYIDREGR